MMVGRAKRHVRDGYTIYHVETEKVEKYVEAKNEDHAKALVLIVYGGPIESVSVTDFDNIEDAVRGDEPPFGCLRYRDGSIVEAEKRVNQGGFKGVYDRYHEIDL